MKTVKLELHKESDKMLFCFTMFNDFMRVRADDSALQKVFQQIHPEQRPIHTISNLQVT